jgi:DNA-directed RNA polymerase subunit N (RpoN/RPB10)
MPLPEAHVTTRKYACFTCGRCISDKSDLLELHKALENKLADDKEAV